MWRFHDFELDETRFELRRPGGRIPIAPKPLALLLHLAKRHPASVSQEELLRTLWPGVRITPASLARAVREVPRTIGLDADADGVIRTVRGRGYAFAASLVPENRGAPDVVAVRDVPFIDRAAELIQFEAALDNAEAGRGRLVFISGEPGIGKSRLLDMHRLRSEAEALGAKLRRKQRPARHQKVRKPSTDGH